MDDAVNAVLADIRTTLGTTPLHFNRRAINENSPPTPYALLVPVSRPASSTNRYRGTKAAAIFGLNVWGTKAACLQIERNLAWLESASVGTYNTSQNLRYSLYTEDFNEEDWLINGEYSAWNLSKTYRCDYENLAAYQGVV